jgi:epoxyqueuosine reductase
MTRDDLTDRLKSEALRLGVDDVGIAPAVTAPGYPNFLQWLEPVMRPAWTT